MIELREILAGTQSEVGSIRCHNMTVRATTAAMIAV